MLAAPWLVTASEGNDQADTQNDTMYAEIAADITDSTDGPGGSDGYESPYAGGDAEGIEDAPDLDESDVPSDDPEPGDGGSDHTIISGRNEGTSDTTVEEEETVVDVTGDGDEAVVTTPDSRTDGTPNAAQEETGVTPPDDSTDVPGDQSVSEWVDGVTGGNGPEMPTPEVPEMPEIDLSPFRDVLAQQQGLIERLRNQSGGVSPMVLAGAAVAIVVAIAGGAAATGE